MTGLTRIGLVLGLAGKYDRAIARGVAAFARPHKPWIFEFVRGTVRAAATLEQWRPDGIIASLINDELAETVRRLNKPTVNVADPTPVFAPPRVNSDQLAVGRLGAEHFLERGFRSFAFLGWPGHFYSDQRQRGFVEALSTAGRACQLPPGPLLPPGPPTPTETRPVNISSPDDATGRWRAAADNLDRWIAGLVRPCGLMACNDYVGWRAAEACHRVAARIPEHIAIIGADDDEVWCNLAYPPLSSVLTAARQIGFQASGLLEDLMAGRAPANNVLLVPPAGVVTRASSDTLAIEDADLAVAIAFIRKHSGDPIRVADVARAAAMSRRSLERRCRGLLGRGPADEIRHARLARARELLARTDLPVDVVAAQAGFSNANRLHVTFTQAFRQTPGKYRKQIRMSM